jgi:hypothetical protein
MMVGITGLHYLYTATHTNIPAVLSAVTELTGLSSPSLSSAFYEPRLLYRQKAENPAYPDMLPINRTDFVYEE